MKLIEPNVQEITDFEGVDNFYKAVARAARICYASDKTTDDKELCERLIKSGHHSPFEHAIITLPAYKLYSISYKSHEILKKLACKYTVITQFEPIKEGNIVSLASINGRILIEAIVSYKSFMDEKICYKKWDVMELLDAMLSLLKKDEILNHQKQPFRSFIVDTSIGCTREMNRHHDNFYICEQSTRYVNFSKGKFGSEVAINIPYWLTEEHELFATKEYLTYMQAMSDLYVKLNEADYQGLPLDAIRGILPLDTHTRAIYTATIEEWQHIIDLRLKGTTGKPHGDIMIIADKIDKLINNK